MATNVSSRALDPSAYIANHLHHFASSSRASASISIAAGHHPAFFMWNVYTFGLAVVLFVALTCVAALRDRGDVFRLPAGMSFGKRLFVWWSCAWRQWLASIPLAIIGLAVFQFLMLRAAVPFGQFISRLITSDSAASSPELSIAIAAMPVIASVLVWMLLSTPIVGYMVRSGLASHGLAGSGKFNLWRATLLGLVTYAWLLPASLLIDDVAVPLPERAADVLLVVFFASWGMYVVLPRQLRSITRAVGFRG